MTFSEGLWGEGDRPRRLDGESLGVGHGGLFANDFEEWIEIKPKGRKIAKRSSRAKRYAATLGGGMLCVRGKREWPLVGMRRSKGNHMKRSRPRQA